MFCSNRAFGTTMRLLTIRFGISNQRPTPSAILSGQYIMVCPAGLCSSRDTPCPNSPRRVGSRIMGVAQAHVYLSVRPTAERPHTDGRL